MLTVAGLTSDLGLELAAGHEGAGKPIRWVHISEVDDPTRWLTGGELLLTTGIGLKSATKQRRFVAMLADHGLAGIGLGTGFEHKRLPKAMVDEAAKRELPLFEVPFEMPFIALTERAFTELVNEGYGVLERGLALQERLERLVIDGRGLDAILAAIGSAVGGSALLLDANGVALSVASPPGLGARPLDVISAEVEARTGAGRIAPFSPEDPSLPSMVLAPLPDGDRPAARTWLAVAKTSGELTDLDRLIARQAAIAVALEIMRDRAVRETERRLAGDVLSEALSGRLDDAEVRGRLRPFGIGAEAAVLVFELEQPSRAADELEAALDGEGVAALVATSSAARKELLCAVVDAGAGDPVGLARTARAAIARDGATVRAAASRPGSAGAVRHAFHEARCALEATSLANGDAPEVASHRDLGAFTLLLALQDDEALRHYSESLLAPIEATDGEYGGELLRSLEAFIEQNGQWERAARELYCHRHTLRYRIRRVEELTGRDLSRAHDRIELWLALRARELVG
ncbi:MAG: PucR family transcriptional regulator ligand-binding domain-containing protein [Solirubrobacterales bacterium]